MFSEEIRTLGEIFFPYNLEQTERVAKDNIRFVHYTSADVALSILQKKRIWMRNAITMNDYSEIQHGKSCLLNSYHQRPCGEQMRALLDGIHPGVSQEIAQAFDRHVRVLEQETFLTCLSEHNPLPAGERLFDEDRFGRLSMWRAYGGGNGIAIVLKPMIENLRQAPQSITISPVAYCDHDQFAREFQRVVDGIAVHRDLVATFTREQIVQTMFGVFKAAILSTKHPGFAEEREWRLFFHPSVATSPLVERAFETVRGVPQEVWKIKLENDPAIDITRADIPTLIDRIIIGPTTQPLTLQQTFIKVLNEAGVPDPASRVWVSLIPLRQY